MQRAQNNYTCTFDESRSQEVKKSRSQEVKKQIIDTDLFLRWPRFMLLILPPGIILPETHALVFVFAICNINGYWKRTNVSTTSNPNVQCSSTGWKLHVIASQHNRFTTFAFGQPSWIDQCWLGVCRGHKQIWISTCGVDRDLNIVVVVVLSFVWHARLEEHVVVFFDRQMVDGVPRHEQSATVHRNIGEKWVRVIALRYLLQRHDHIVARVGQGLFRFGGWFRCWRWCVWWLSWWRSCFGNDNGMACVTKQKEPKKKTWPTRDQNDHRA